MSDTPAPTAADDIILGDDLIHSYPDGLTVALVRTQFSVSAAPTIPTTLCGLPVEVTEAPRKYESTPRNRHERRALASKRRKAAG